MTEAEIRTKLGLTSREEAEYTAMERTVGMVMAKSMDRRDAIRLRHRGSGRTTNMLVLAMQQLSVQTSRVFIVVGCPSARDMVQKKVNEYCKALDLDPHRVVIMSKEVADRDLDRGYTEGGENPLVLYDNSTKLRD